MDDAQYGRSPAVEILDRAGRWLLQQRLELKLTQQLYPTAPPKPSLEDEWAERRERWRGIMRQLRSANGTDPLADPRALALARNRHHTQFIEPHIRSAKRAR